MKLKMMVALAGVFVGVTAANGAEPGPEWKAVEGRLMTRWGKQVTPENAWREYPRPQMVREKWMNLNGLWGYAVAGADAPEPGAETGKILVPYPIESALSGVGKPLEPGARLWYRRNFVIPEDWKGQRVLLHFGAVDWSTEVMVNGKSVGKHTGGYDAFAMDVTAALRAGENTLTVGVTDPTDKGGQPRGKQWLKPEGIWYTRTSGIWQTVWMEPVGAESIESLAMVPDVFKGQVTIKTVTRGLDGRAGWTVHARVLTKGVMVTGATAPVAEAITLTIPQPRYWSPGAPFLYDVEVTLSDDKAVRDTVTGYFGLRDIRVAQDRDGVNRLMFNGRPLFQFGPLDQGFWPDGIYTPPSDEAMKFDIEAVKKMGGNMLRKHVKVEPDRFYAWCDRLGVLVWQDMPSPFFPENDVSGIDWKANFESELSRMVHGLGNHPSIVMWVPFNEGWGQHETEKYVAMIKKWDPTRLVNNASGWTDTGGGDVRDIHAYPAPETPPTEPNRAAVLGEFGGLGLPVDGHTWVAKDNWGYVSYKNQNELTDAYVDLMKRIPLLIGQGLCAAVYTQTTDCEIECNGWLTYDREVWKVDPAKVMAATLACYGEPPVVRTVVPRAGQDGAPQWWYTTSKPEEGWQKPGFDAAGAGWKQGKGGFGTAATPGAIVGTEWKSGDIWIRCEVQIDRVVSAPQLSIHHDEDAQVYINGELAASLKGYTSGYGFVPLDKGAAERLVRGANTIAIHCHQTQGGQYIDCGIVEVVTGK